MKYVGIILFVLALITCLIQFFLSPFQLLFPFGLGPLFPIGNSGASKDYSNLDAYQDAMYERLRSLEQKYSIKSYGFDMECIYKKESLARLVDSTLKNLLPTTYKIVETSEDVRNQVLITRVKIQDQVFSFQTSAASDWLDEGFVDSLNVIAKRLYPDCEFYYVNPPYDQTAIVIFLPRQIAEQAVDEGFPLTLESGIWQLDKGLCEHGVYSNVKLKKVPSFDAIRQSLYKNLEALRQQGYQVPDLTLKRIYVTDTFKENKIDIYIDGRFFPYSSEIKGNRVQCFWDSYCVLLAYCLVKDFGGEPELEYKSGWTNELSQQEYIEKALATFGRK